MKLNKAHYLGIILVLIVFISCDNLIDPDVRDQTVPDNLFNTVQGIESVLYSAYAHLALVDGNNTGFTIASQEFWSDLSLQSGGGIESDLNPLQNFTVTAADNTFPQMWARRYQAIRDANVIFEEIPDAPIEENEKELIMSEARFIRAASYLEIYYNYGPGPLRISRDQEPELPRASEEEMLEFIESELLASISGLPEPGEEKAYGRAHKAAAMGLLTKFYLNTNQWQKSAEMAQEIIDLQEFSLWPDYFTLFWEQNEGNEEMIWVRPTTATADRDAANPLLNWIYPIAFYEHPRTGLVWPEGARNFPAHWRFYDSFYDSFDPDDERRSLIVEEYVNLSGELIVLTEMENQTRPFKYWPDQGAEGPAYGNDIPVIRYADILLSRAEALNELNGPNQESIDLINQVRNRAGVSSLVLTDFGSTDELRAHILQERAWEFWWEGKRRKDLIRHGKFIEKAHARGATNAQDFHVRFPIPQSVMDANPNLEQNPGY